MTEKRITVNELEKEFMCLIGKCITEWARIEEELFVICHLILAITHERAAIVYYRTPTIDARLSLVDELIETALPKPKKKNGGHAHTSVKAWKTLLSKIRGHLKTRNRIAHSPASPHIDTISIDISPADIFYASFVSPHEKARGRSDEHLPLKKEHLEAHLTAVGELYMELRSFSKYTLRNAIKVPT